jgi:hypothetical protein
MKKRVFLLFVLLLSIFSPSFAEEDEETTIEKEIKAVITLKEVIGDYRQE